jgi:hypothetical protein
MSNPMQDYKKTLTKEYEIDGKKIVFRTLSTSELDEIETTITAKSIFAQSARVKRASRR